MRHSDKAKMGLALAGLVFCLTSAEQTMVRKKGPTTVPATSAAVAKTKAVGAVQASTLPSPIQPSVMWKQRLEDDEAVRLITLGRKSHMRVMRRSESRQAFQQFSDALLTAKPTAQCAQPVAYVAVFYRRDGSLDWTVDITRDRVTMYDPMHNCYLRAAQDLTRWFTNENPAQ